MHSKCVCIFAEMGFLLIIFAEILLTIWDPHPAQIVKNHRGTRYGLAQRGDVVLMGESTLPSLWLD